jgi:glutamate dehydrogenase/leucine dehydrogenase
MMCEERLKILKMIEEQKISAAEAMELLKAMDETAPLEREQAAGSTGGKKCLRVRVMGEKAKKVNVNIPLNLVKVASKFAVFGMGLIPEEARKELERKGIDLSQLDLEEVLTMIEQGLDVEKLVDIDVDDPEEGRVKVEVYVD